MKPALPVVDRHPPPIEPPDPDASGHHGIGRPRKRAALIAMLSIALLIAGVCAVLGVTGALAGPSWTVFASDQFNRSASSGWGSADTGGVYTGYVPPGTRLSVKSGSGVVTGLPAGQTLTRSLSKAVGQDIEIGSTFAVSAVPRKGSSLYYAIRGRVKADGSSYSATVRVSTSGRATLTISRVNGRKVSLLKNMLLPFTVTAGKPVHVLLDVAGSTKVSVSAKAWTDAQPASALSAADSAGGRVVGSGSLAIVAYAQIGGASQSFVVGDVSGNSEPTGVVLPPPSATPSPTPAPVSTTPVSGDGSGLGSTNYAVPGNAIFVSPSGNDSGSGSQSSPLLTLGAAVNRAASGRTIVMRAGSYHESVTVPDDKALTIQSYPHEVVWLDGSSPVTNWTKSGSTWVATGWRATFSDTMLGVPNNPRWVTSANPMAAHPDQVFVDSKSLRQVSSAKSVVAGTFAVDYGAHTLTIGADPAGHLVRATDLAQGLFVKSSGTTVQGIGVRRYAAPYDVGAALESENTNTTLRDLVVTDNGTVGVSVRDVGNLIERLDVERNGLLGIAANEAYGLVLRNSVVTNNDSEHFNFAPVAGGVKVTRSRGLTITGNTISNNFGSGLWLDESCYSAVVAHNVTDDNEYSGIVAELSSSVIIVDNESTGNREGITVQNSGGVQIYNNEVGDDSLFGVHLWQDSRRQANGSTPGHDPRRPVPDPTVTWLTKNIVVADNVFGGGGLFQFYGLDVESHIPLDNMGVTIDGNVFNKRTSSGDATMVGWGASDDKTVVRYESPQALASAKNTSWHNGMSGQNTSMTAMLAMASSSSSIARPLPADVAAAAGKPAGTRVVGRF